jgi:dihydrofolate reductase
VKSANPNISFRLSEDDAAFLEQTIESTGALVVGRRLFDVAHGWNGVHPVGVPVFVVTHQIPTPGEFPHPDAPFTFVTDGVESAIGQAKAAAGDKDVAIASPGIAQQALDAGLLDVITVDLAPCCSARARRISPDCRRRRCDWTIRRSAPAAASRTCAIGCCAETCCCNEPPE